MGDSDKHVHTRPSEVAGHEEEGVKKHLTMKYNMKDLRKFTEFEMWVAEWIEEQIADERKRPLVEAQALANLDDGGKRNKLHEMLGNLVSDQSVLDGFIDEYIAKYKKLPKAVLKDLSESS